MKDIGGNMRAIEPKEVLDELSLTLLFANRHVFACWPRRFVLGIRSRLRGGYGLARRGQWRTADEELAALQAPRVARLPLPSPPLPSPPPLQAAESRELTDR